MLRLEQPQQNQNPWYLSLRETTSITDLFILECPCAVLEISARPLTNASVKIVSKYKSSITHSFGQCNFHFWEIIIIIWDSQIYLPVIHNIVDVFHSTKNSGDPKEVIWRRPEQERLIATRNGKLNLRDYEIVKKCIDLVCESFWRFLLEERHLSVWVKLSLGEYILGVTRPNGRKMHLWKSRMSKFSSSLFARPFVSFFFLSGCHSLIPTCWIKTYWNPCSLGTCTYVHVG